MKKLFYTIALCLVLYSVKAQYVPIPDQNLLYWFSNNGFAQCINGNELDTTCSLVGSTTHIQCPFAGINNLEGLQYFHNLQSITLDGNYVNDFSALPPSVTGISVNSSGLSSISNLPAGLTDLSLIDNQLSSLPPLPNSLNTLDITGNQFTALPSLPQNLSTLNCSRNYLTSISNLPGNIYSLNCSMNQLTTLSLPSTYMNAVDCSHNSLSTINATALYMYQLYCWDNLLTSLPPITSINTLLANNNQLATLPNLPTGIAAVNVRDNSLTSLPTLPSSLSALACDSNNLNALPVLPNGMRYLTCSYNNITTLPTALPDSLNLLDCRNNQISCLPLLISLDSLNFTNTLVNCLPNAPAILQCQPPLNTLPLCDIFNTNGCALYWNLGGKVHVESDGNCLHDTLESFSNDIKITLLKNGSPIKYTYTTQGQYLFDVDTLTAYTIEVDTTQIPYTLNCPPLGYHSYTLSTVDSLVNNLDFALQCPSGFDVGVSHIISLGLPRPANPITIRTNAGDIAQNYGSNCAIGISGAVTLSWSGPVTYASPAPGALTPTVAGTTATWNIADFGNIINTTAFNLLFQVDTMAAIGNQICITVNVTPTAGDNNPANNSLTYCVAVVNSSDPNTKSVSPVADIDTSQEWLTYTINFQNTGNAPAQNIYIVDTLDANVDASSFQRLAYSHDNITSISNTGIVKFNFPNIQLPDSNSNEPASHGYVQYKVKLKEGMPVGTAIANTAYIYFDFNAPVVTNTTVNTITLSNSIQDVATLPAIQLYPNPAKDAVNLMADKSFIGGKLQLIDLNGRLLNEQFISSTNTTVALKGFPTGLYLVKAINQKGLTAFKRLAVE
ncbi:MAG: T9SS type A sorting domain-containing protein [Chitinophagales bacterium]